MQSLRIPMVGKAGEPLPLPWERPSLRNEEPSHRHP